MKIQYSFSHVSPQPGKNTLDKMLSRMLGMFQPVAVRHNSFIVNDIAPGFYVSADEKLLERALGSLLISVISRCHNSCIRVSAKLYNNIVLLRINESTGRFTHGLEDSLYHSQLLAAKLGGCVVTNNLRKTQSTVTFTFMNSMNAA
jgi:hypothetical protein